MSHPQQSFRLLATGSVMVIFIDSFSFSAPPVPQSDDGRHHFAFSSDMFITELLRYNAYCIQRFTENTLLPLDRPISLAGLTE